MFSVLLNQNRNPGRYYNDARLLTLPGVHNTVVSWIRSQPNPKQPAGTIINVNSAMAGMTIPGNSAYTVSKIAAHKYMEYVAAGKLLLHSPNHSRIV